MAETILSLGRVCCPESFTRDRDDPTLTTNPSELQEHCCVPESVGKQLDAYVSSNLVGSFLIVGTIEHPDNFLSMDIPFYCCNFCDFKTVQKAEVKKHLQSHRFGCKFCNFEIFTRAEVIRHTVKCHKDELKNELIRYCVYANDKELYHKKAEEVLPVSMPQEEVLPVSVPQVVVLPVPPVKGSKKRTIAELQVLGKKIKLESIDDVLEDNAVHHNQIEPAYLNGNQTSNKSDSHNSEISTSINRISGNVPPMYGSPRANNINFTNDIDLNTDPFNSNSVLKVENNFNNENSRKTCDSPQSYLRSILTSDQVGKSNLTSAGSSNNKPANESPSTNNAHDRSVRLQNDAQTCQQPNIKIEIDDDSYSNNFGYIPQTMTVSENGAKNSFYQLSNPVMEDSGSRPDQHVQYLDYLLEVGSSHSNSTSSPMTFLTNENGNDHPDRQMSGAEQLKTSAIAPSGSKNLPILRNMLTKPGPSLKRSYRKTKKKAIAIEVDISDASDADSKDDDEDYCPYSSEEEQVQKYVKSVSVKSKRRSTRSDDKFSCLNCDEGVGTFAHIKDHLLSKHHCTNLLVNDAFRNMLVFFCPLEGCDYRDPRFSNFNRHLIKCGVYKRGTPIGNKKIQLSILMTLHGLLENVQTEWQFACNICAKTFTTLADTQKHKVEVHSQCYDDKGLFKYCEENQEVMIICLLCSTHFDILQWPELSSQSCSRHQTQGVRGVSELSRSNLKGYLQNLKKGSGSNVDDSDPSIPSDQTPQLRAILQKTVPKLRGSGGDDRSPEEDMPASRMLQWLISEGSRMMHFLKE